MNSKQRTVATTLTAILILLTSYCLFNLGNKPDIDTNNIKQSAHLEYPSTYNYRQSINNCGPFNVAAAVRTLTNKNVSSSLFAKEIGWRLPNKYTLPWGLEKQLKDHNIKIEKPNFKVLKDSEKLALIQEKLSLSKPIIILGERENYEHYITILGFDSSTNEYYIYDSLQTASAEQPQMTTDENGALPGNATLNSNDLLNFWGSGGMYGFWEWYGLVAG